MQDSKKVWKYFIDDKVARGVWHFSHFQCCGLVFVEMRNNCKGSRRTCWNGLNKANTKEEARRDRMSFEREDILEEECWLQVMISETEVYVEWI